MLFSQAELPQLYKDFVKINENAKKIKDSKISKCSIILIGTSMQDTTSTRFYDMNGNLSKEISLSENVSDMDSRLFYNRFLYKYDGNGRLLEKIDSTNGQFRKTILAYSDLGDIVKEEIRDAFGNTLIEVSNEYDNLGRLIESSEKNVAGNCKIIKQYAYDSYNNMAKYSVKNNCEPGKNHVLTYVYKYDKRSNIIEKNLLNPVTSASSYRTESYTYSVNGNLTQSYIITGEGQYTISVFTYDKANVKVKAERTEVNGTDQSKFTELYTYDIHGNIMEIKEIDETGTQVFLTRYVYEFYN